jgi:hypothetical protein
MYEALSPPRVRINGAVLRFDIPVRNLKRVDVRTPPKVGTTKIERELEVINYPFHGRAILASFSNETKRPFLWSRSTKVVTCFTALLRRLGQMNHKQSRKTVDQVCVTVDERRI